MQPQCAALLCIPHPSSGAMQCIFALAVYVFVVFQRRTRQAPLVWSVAQTLHHRICNAGEWFVMLWFTTHRGCARAFFLASVDVPFWLPMQDLLANRCISICRGFLRTSATRKLSQTGTNPWGSFAGGISRQHNNGKQNQRQNMVDGFQGPQTTPTSCPPC